MAAEEYGNRRARIVLNETYTGGYSTPVFRPSSRRTSSFSSPSFSSTHSSSFSNSFNDSSYDDSPFSPNTPLRFSSSSSSSAARIPFSWEQLPGIPKDDTTTPRKNKNESSSHTSNLLLLPLPPAAGINSSSNSSSTVSPPRKYCRSTTESSRKDPFFAAMVECSKDDLWKASKLTKSTVSNRFGFVNMMYTSCKRTCAVSESIVYLPRSRASSYNMLSRRPT